MKVLSLFDGIACGLQALKEAKIPVDVYYASEIDKYAIQIAKRNHPEIIELGDIKNWKDWNLGEIDMIIGGPPCQDLSIAGKRAGLNGERSGLFWVMVDIINYYKPKYFLVENVASMPKEAKQTMTDVLGVEPILINSALLTAQNRKRLYRTNISGITQPEDKGIMIKDILEEKVDNKYYMTEEQFNKLKFNSLIRLYFDKYYTLNTIQGGHRQPKIIVNKYNNRILETKCGTLGTCNGFTNKQGYQVIEGNYKIRKLTPKECERLQGLPDNYTDGISDTQRYKMIGNGWTIPVISHIFSFIK